MRPFRCLVRPLTAVFPFLALAAAGCLGSSEVVDTLPRVPVSGNVTLDGSPMPTGQVQFEPAANTKGVTAVGEVVDGKYAIPKAVGPVPGKYQVMITSRPVAKVQAGEAPGAGVKPKPEMVSPKYNTQTTLEAEVKGAVPNTFDFAVKKK